ncbi:hypothetical protein FZEAL_6635, partial [Fusarium zealandicum]
YARARLRLDSCLIWVTIAGYKEKGSSGAASDVRLCFLSPFLRIATSQDFEALGEDAE